MNRAPRMREPRDREAVFHGSEALEGTFEIERDRSRYDALHRARPRGLGRGHTSVVNEDGTCGVERCAPTAMCSVGPGLVECPGAPVAPRAHVAS